MITPAQFQKDQHKIVGGVANAMYPRHFDNNELDSGTAAHALQVRETPKTGFLSISHKRAHISNARRMQRNKLQL